MITELLAALEQHGITGFTSNGGYTERTYGPVLVWIVERPGYCDRGRWIWHASSSDPRICTIDGGDCFPRYFFNADCLAQELSAWLVARNLVTEPATTIDEASA